MGPGSSKEEAKAKQAPTCRQPRICSGPAPPGRLTRKRPSPHPLPGSSSLGSSVLTIQVQRSVSRQLPGRPPARLQLSRSSAAQRKPRLRPQKRAQNGACARRARAGGRLACSCSASCSRRTFSRARSPMESAAFTASFSLATVERCRRNAPCPGQPGRRIACSKGLAARTAAFAPGRLPAPQVPCPHQHPAPFPTAAFPQKDASSRQ